MPFIGCVLQVTKYVVGMTMNICRQQEQINGNTFLLFAVHVTAVNNCKTTVLLCMYEET